MFTDIDDYMMKSKPERQEHLKLGEECVVIGGNSENFRGMLAWHLHTTMPKGKNIHLCHACKNGKCSNVNHLYWGTNAENQSDNTGNKRPNAKKPNRKVVSVYSRNLIWINDGRVSKRILRTEDVPSGFVRGRLPTQKQLDALREWSQKMKTKENREAARKRAIAQFSKKTPIRNDIGQIVG